MSAVAIRATEQAPQARTLSNGSSFGPRFLSRGLGQLSPASNGPQSYTVPSSTTTRPRAPQADHTTSCACIRGRTAVLAGRVEMSLWSRCVSSQDHPRVCFANRHERPPCCFTFRCREAPPAPGRAVTGTGYKVPAQAVPVPPAVPLDPLHRPSRSASSGSPGPRAPPSVDRNALQAKKTCDAAEPNGPLWAFLLRPWNSVGAGERG